ncbi:hypothetical protein MKY41_10350 [Sporosarcina sp. FSL W7-1349]
MKKSRQFDDTILSEMDEIASPPVKMIGALLVFTGLAMAYVYLWSIVLGG